LSRALYYNQQLSVEQNQAEVSGNTMNGQWIGKYIGSNSGDIIFNVDDRGWCYRGVAYLTPYVTDHQKAPTLGIGFWTKNKDSKFDFSTGDLWPIHPITGNQGNWDDVLGVSGIKHFYPDVKIPKRIDFNGQWDRCCLRLSWKTDLESTASCELPRSRADEPSGTLRNGMVWF
jgi:hypothetical protein